MPNWLCNVVVAGRIAALAALLVAGCATSERWDNPHVPPPGGPGRAPQWVQTGSHPDYPDGRFITGFGVSDLAAGEADAQATAALRRALEAAVIGEVTDRLAPQPQPQSQPHAPPGDEDDQPVAPNGEIAPPPEPDAVSPAEVVHAVSTIITDTLLERTPPRRAAWYSDGFTHFALHAIGFDDLVEGWATAGGESTGGTDDPGDDTGDDTGDRLRAFRVIAIAGACRAAANALAGQPGPQPPGGVDLIAALGVQWRELVRINAGLHLELDGRDLPLRVRRGEAVALPLKLGATTAGSAGGAAADDGDDADGVRFVRLCAENRQGHSTLTLGSDPTGGAVSHYIAPPPAARRPRELTPQERLADALERWRTGLDMAVTRDTTLSLQFVPLDADGQSGHLRLVLADVPTAFRRWWPMLPVATLDVPWVVPAASTLRWRSEIVCTFDGEVQPPELMQRLLQALLIRAGHASLAQRPPPSPADDDDGSGDPVSDDPRVFTVTFRGPVNVETRPGGGGEVRAAVEILLDDNGVSLGGLPLRGSSRDGDALDVLRQALERTDVRQLLRRAIADVLR